MKVGDESEGKTKIKRDGVKMWEGEREKKLKEEERYDRGKVKRNRGI
jgi:hypothetical protein